MLIVIEILLLLIGLYALIGGKLPVNSGARYVVRGWHARLIGGIGLLPVPLTFVVGIVVGLLFVGQGKRLTQDSFLLVGIGIEAACLVTCVVAMLVLARIYRTPLTAAEIPDGSRTFEAPLPTILEAIDDTLHDMKVKAIKWSDDGRRVTGRVGASLWSWAEWLTVEADESGEVRVRSTCVASWQLIDWGKNAQNRRRFLKRLTVRLESPVSA
jgi:hypothetical protein